MDIPSRQLSPVLAGKYYEHLQILQNCPPMAGVHANENT